MTKASEMNRDQLRKVAAARGIAGRGTMNVEQLRTVVTKALRSAPLPMTSEARGAAYTRQNGTRRLTSAQIRRYKKKERAAR